METLRGKLHPVEVTHDLMVVSIEVLCPHNDRCSHYFRAVKTLNFCLPHRCRSSWLPSSGEMCACIAV